MTRRIVSFSHLLQLLTTPPLKIYAPFFACSPPPKRHYMFTEELRYLLLVQCSLDSGTVTVLP